MSKEYNIGIYIRLSMADEDTGYGSKADANFRTALWWYAHHIQQSCRLT